MATDATGPALPDKVSVAMAKKTHEGWWPMLLLAVLAGAFIGMGSIGFLVVQGVEQATGPVQLLSGVAFSVGLILVTVTGAELFTGNTMMTLPAAEGAVSPARLAAAWAVVWIGNLIGGVVVAALFVAAGGAAGVDGMVGEAAVSVATTKVDKGAAALIASGVMANLLVCLAVWMATGAQSIGGKIAAIVGPVALFVAAGFEHSVANMSLLPIGWMLDTGGAIDAAGVARNLALATLGNIVGGGGLALLLRHGADPDRATF